GLLRQVLNRAIDKLHSEMLLWKVRPRMAILMADGRSRFTAVSRFKDEAITDDRKKYAPTALSLCENASRRRASPFLKCNQWSTVNDPSGGASDEQRNHVPVEHHRRTRRGACRAGPGRCQTGCQEAGEEESRQETGGEEVGQEGGEESRQEGREESCEEGRRQESREESCEEGRRQEGREERRTQGCQEDHPQGGQEGRAQGREERRRQESRQEGRREEGRQERRPSQEKVRPRHRDAGPQPGRRRFSGMSFGTSFRTSL